MAAIAEAAIVVVAAVVGMPEIDQRARHRLAAARQHEPRELDLPPAEPGSTRSARCGERGLKNGPSVCAARRLVAVARIAASAEGSCASAVSAKPNAAGGERRGRRQQIASA